MRTVLDGPVAPPVATRELVIDFMYLDLETCTRCRGTDANLEAALVEVKRILDATGVDISVRKTLVGSAEQANALGFVSSPTIRVNDQDVALELRESSCAECGEACGCDGAIDCRVWVWRGQEYTVAPTAMIVDTILREVYGGMARVGPQNPVDGQCARELDTLLRRQGPAGGRAGQLLFSDRAGRVLRAIAEGVMLRRSGLR